MRERFYYFACLVACVACYLFLRWLYSTRFRLAINAIRDDEDKAEALGLRTGRYKMVAWAVSAFFLAIAGALFGNMTGFVEPLETAYPTLTFGVFMVAMALLGGKGTLWGPVIGATLFYALRELTWTYLLGWQYIALGLLIIVNVVYFQQGILGWVASRRKEAA
jgi:branched-chain amino acid transport system permease protein